MFRIKLILLNKLRNYRTSKVSDKVSSQVANRDIVWSITAFMLKSLILMFFGFLIIFPFYFMISSALMTQNEMLDPTQVHLVPQHAQWGNFAKALEDGYWKAILYTFLITFASVLLKVFITMLMGYAFSLSKWRFKKVIWWTFLAILMLPEVALMNGQYFVMAKLKWDGGSNVIMAMVVPFVASVFSGFMFRNAFEAIPTRTKEAALIDGASEGRYFFKVAMPMVAPTTWIVVILTAFAAWNSYMWPSLLLQGKDVQVINTWVFTTGHEVGPDSRIVIPVRIAASILAMIPMLIVYGLFRKRIMNAVSRQGSAIKG